jgi:hypothetical protein
MSGFRHSFATIGSRSSLARPFALLFLLALGFGILAGTPAAANPCTSAIDMAEREYAIPPRLLLAIAITESGVNGIPYPWTVHVAGRAFYAPSQAAATRYLRDKKGKLRTNAFAGCMQLSVRYHRANFDAPEQMLNPESNVDYAARFLASLKADYETWAAAILRYYGGKPRASEAYLCRVWRTLGLLEPASLRLIETTRCGAVPDAAQFDTLPVAQPGVIEDEDTVLKRRLDRRELT